MIRIKSACVLLPLVFISFGNCSDMYGLLVFVKGVMISFHRKVAVAVLIRWIHLLLYLSLFNGSKADFTVVVPGDPVSGLFGSSVSLPCDLSPALNAELFEVRWYRPELYETPILLYKDQQILESSADPQFRGRVSLIGELKKGNVSLKLDNLKLQDGGDYMCYVQGGNWYDEAQISVKLKVVGSVPILSVAEVEGEQINVSCLSSGWLPKPSITWWDSRGRNVTNISKNKFTVSDPEGFVSVSSWLLVSPSESEWISCSVSLSDLEVRESRILPHMTRDSDTVCTKPRNEPYITSTVILLIFSLFSTSAAVILFLKLKQIQVAANKDDREKNQSPSEETETSPLNSSSSLKTKHEHEEHQTEYEVKLSDSGSESVPNPVLPAETETGNKKPTNKGGKSKDHPKHIDDVKKFEEKITIDPQKVPDLFKIEQDEKIICVHTKEDNQQAPFALCEEKFSTGKHYWEVKVCDKPNQKLSWYVGVADETAECLYQEQFKPENGFWILCYEHELGIHMRNSAGEITFRKEPSDSFTTVGLFLDCDEHTLTFYDVDDESHLYTIKSVKPNPSLSPLISPGVRDTYPVQITKH